MVRIPGRSLLRMPGPTDYASRFNDAMRAAGKTEHDVAEALGITYQAVKKILNGTSKMLRADNNVVAARLFGVSSEWLATGKGSRNIAAEPPKQYRPSGAESAPPPPPGNFSRHAPPTESEWAVLHDLRVLPQTERDKLLADVRNRAELFRAYTAEVLARAKKSSVDR